MGEHDKERKEFLDIKICGNMEGEGGYGAESGDVEAQEHQRQGASCTESLGCDSGDISGEENVQ